MRLDGRLIETLIRNGPDQTGRPSVTIADSEIRSVIFEQLDPTANLPEMVIYEDSSWAWFPGKPSFGRLLMHSGDAGAIHLPLYGLKAPAAQFLTFAVNCDPGTDIGLLLETVTGGRFYFGGRCAAEQIRAPLAAKYLMATTGPAGPGWREPDRPVLRDGVGSRCAAGRTDAQPSSAGDDDTVQRAGGIRGQHSQRCVAAAARHGVVRSRSAVLPVRFGAVGGPGATGLSGRSRAQFSGSYAVGGSARVLLLPRTHAGHLSSLE